MENVKTIPATSVWVNNEVLFKTKIKAEPFIRKKLREVVKGMRAYGFNNLQNSWLAYSNKNCPRCKASIRKEQVGKNKCVNYFCYNCQLLFRK